MKILQISNGEIRKGYELNDLAEQVKENVIIEHASFLASMPVSVENEDGQMEDVYEDYDRNDVIETIEANKYLYDEKGELLPIVYHVRGNNNEVWKMTFMDKYEVVFI